MKIRAAVLLLFAALLPLAAGAATPFASSEPGPAPYRRSNPAIASNGSGHLAIWLDSRGSGVWGQRLRNDGTLVDDVSFFIGGNDGGQLTAADVASDGTDYLVAYNGYDGGDPPWTTRFARVTPDGVVTPLPEAVAGNWPGILSLAWGGTAYVLTNSSDGRATVIARDGKVLRSNIALAADAQSLEITEFDGSVLATWVHAVDSRVHGGLVDAATLADERYAPIAHTPQPASAKARIPRAACHAGGCLVAWLEETPESAERLLVKVRRLDARGQVAGEAAAVGEAIHANRLGVAWDGTAYTVTWNESGAMGVRISSAGVSGTTRRLNDWFWADAVTGANGRAIILSSTPGAVSSQIVAQTFDGGAPGAPYAISRALPAQGAPAVSPCGSDNAYAWVERSDRDRVRFARGAFPLTSRGLRESELQQRAPAVACGSSHALVAWVETDATPNIAGASFWIAAIDHSTGGMEAVRLGPASSDLYVQRPAAIWNGSEFLVAWRSTSRELLLTRIAVDGRVIDPVPYTLETLPDLSIDDANPSLAWNGSEYLIGWQRRRTIYPEVIILSIPIIASTTHVARLGRTLQLAGPPAVLPRVPLDDRASASPPIVAAAPHGWLVTWEQAHGGSTASETLAMRLRSDLTTSDSAAGLLLTRGYSTTPIAAMWDGREWLIASSGTILRVPQAGTPPPVDRPVGSEGFDAVAPSPRGYLRIAIRENAQRVPRLVVLDEPPVRRRVGR